jgi:hypothetical protein
VISGPLKWYEVASRVEQAIYADLTEKPDRHSVVPGAIAWDACDCGLLAVSLVQIYVSELFPDLQSRRVGNKCDAPYEVGEFVVQLIRCAPNPDDQTGVPTVEALDASAREVDRDAYEVLKAVSELLCQMNADREISDFMLRPLTSQGPSGGCVGNELRFFVSLLRN